MSLPGSLRTVLRSLGACAWLFCTDADRAAADTLTVGPFTVEAVERKIGAGGFPNTSGNPFKRTLVTTYRVLHKGKPIVPPGTAPDRGAPWWEARVLSGAPQPTVLLMESGAFLLTDASGQPRLQELAPRHAARTQWQWLDVQQGPGDIDARFARKVWAGDAGSMAASRLSCGVTQRLQTDRGRPGDAQAVGMAPQRCRQKS